MKNEVKKANYSVPVSDVDALCQAADPLIKTAINQYPTYKPKYKNEMYNVCILAILENYPRYDEEKGDLGFFYKHMIGALDEFIAYEVHSFSSLQKYKDYVNIKKVIPHVDQKCLTTDEYSNISKRTGLQKKAVDRAIIDSLIGKPESLSNNEYELHDSKDPYEQLDDAELHDVIQTALKTLNRRDTEFVYDMCGFNGRPILNDFQLRRKYGLSPDEMKFYLKQISRKLLGSRKLRYYLGHMNMHGYCMVG